LVSLYLDIAWQLKHRSRIFQNKVCWTRRLIRFDNETADGTGGIHYELKPVHVGDSVVLDRKGLARACLIIFFSGANDLLWRARTTRGSIELIHDAALN
jgi:hypothetical protein